MTSLTDQPTSAPTRKVSAGAFAGALVILVAFALESAGVDVPATVSASLTTVVTFVVQYFTRERAS